MIQIFRFIIIALVLNSCNEVEGNLISYNIEFDGAKIEYYDKYNMWLNIDDTKEVNILSQLVKSTSETIRCKNTRPVMWEINVFGNYENGKSKHILKLGSSTYSKEALKLTKIGCVDNHELTRKLKEFMLVDKIKMHKGKMRQFEFDRLKNE